MKFSGMMVAGLVLVGGALGGCATSRPVDPHAALIRDAIQMGFHKKTIKGEVNWCHGYTPMGSHLEREECMTEERMAAFLKQQQENRDSLSRPSSCASGSGACGGGG